MRDENANEGVEQRINHIVQNDPDFAAKQIRRIVAMARINVPALETSDIEQIVTALGGVNLRPLDQMPWEEMPLRIARRVSDPKLSAYIAEFDPFEAYLLLVCAELASVNRKYAKDVVDDAFFPLLGRDLK